MPLPILAPIRGTLARVVWRRIADDVVDLAVDLINDGVNEEEAIEFGLSIGMDVLEAATPAILQAATELGQRIDDAVEWKWVRNAGRREWLEAHDDLGPFLRALTRRALSKIPEAGRTPAPLR